jgi:ABC-type transporter Mla subunit MlaD
MQVDPTKLVELADSSERILDEMRQDWSRAVEDLALACDALGDATGMRNIAASYADSLTDAGETLTALAEALEMGVTGLVDAARDAVRADDTVAVELGRAAHQIAADVIGILPPKGGR